MKPKITAAVRKRLERIAKLQRQWARLISELESELSLSSVTDPQDNWTWSMYANQHGQPCSAETLETWLIEFLALKSTFAKAEAIAKAKAC